MKSKIEVQNDNFSKLISLNLPPIQSRFIAYELAENNVFSFDAEYNDSILKITTENEVYNIEINIIDIPTNSILKS
jgi:hypothetical protein